MMYDNDLAILSRSLSPALFFYHPLAPFCLSRSLSLVEIIIIKKILLQWAFDFIQKEGWLAINCASISRLL